MLIDLSKLQLEAVLAVMSLGFKVLSVQPTAMDLGEELDNRRMKERAEEAEELILKAVDAKTAPPALGSGVAYPAWVRGARP